MRISDWSSDVCSSDLLADAVHEAAARLAAPAVLHGREIGGRDLQAGGHVFQRQAPRRADRAQLLAEWRHRGPLSLPDSSKRPWRRCQSRSEEHTSELQSLMRSSNAVFCWKKKKI